MRMLVYSRMLLNLRLRRHHLSPRGGGYGAWLPWSAHVPAARVHVPTVVHVSAQDRIHAGLVPPSAAPEELKDVGVDSQLDCDLPRWEFVGDIPERLVD